MRVLRRARPWPVSSARLGDVLDRLGRRAAAERGWGRVVELERLFAVNGGRNLLETAVFDLDHDRSACFGACSCSAGSVGAAECGGDHVLAWALYESGRCAEARRASVRSLRLGTLMWRASITAA